MSTTTEPRLDVWLIHFNGIGALIKLSTRDTTADQFGEMQRRFASECGARVDFADMIRLDPQQSAEGVLYDWELAGPDGASYRLIRFPTTEDGEIDRAKDYLRRSFDVVRLSVLSIRRLIDFAA